MVRQAPVHRVDNQKRLPWRLEAKPVYVLGQEGLPKNPNRMNPKTRLQIGRF